MERGFMLERTQGGEWATKWLPGAPEPDTWRGTKTDDLQRFPIEAYRCPRCGALRLFAPVGEPTPHPLTRHSIGAKVAFWLAVILIPILFLTFGSR